jgi:hypothetical protein
VRRFVIAAVVLPLLTGVALAKSGGGPGGGAGGHSGGGGGADPRQSGAFGPAAYPNSAELWAQQRNAANTFSLKGWLSPGPATTID